MNSATVFSLALVLAACSGAAATEEPPFLATVETISATRTAEVDAGISTPVPTLAPGCLAEIVDGVFQGVVCEATREPQPQRTNWLLLGGDYRAHREGTGWGNKTDAIVLVSVLETDPVEISIVQFPRNLYVPTSLGDIWLFAVWGEEGWGGLHTYFQQVFGVSLQGIHYINMDSFVQIVDELGEIRVTDSGGAYQLGGEDALSYLRDNENNWGMGSYDAQERVFKVLTALWERGSTFLLEDPVAAANIVYSQWGGLFQTDLGNIKQLRWLFTLGWKVRNAEKEIRFVQLEEPFIIRGDTPIVQDEKPTRGMIANTDLKEWMSCVLDWNCE